MNEDAVLDTPLWDDTWLPVPRLDIEPNGPLRLLNIILDPKDPCNEHKIISTHNPNIAFSITEFELPNMDNTERLLSRGVSNVRYPGIYGRGDAVSLDCFCKSLKVTTVNTESILGSIRTRATEPRVREALRDISRNPAPRPLYIITGIKVATGGTMDSVWRQWPERRANMGYSNNPEEEVRFMEERIRVPASACRSDHFEWKDPIILAYQVKDITAEPGSRTLEVRKHTEYVGFRTVVELLQDMGRVEAPLVQTE
ncbi:uncharacterized protein AKAW2_61300A [Aspergillus luchuensis]|uniref:Similar to An12g09930 n=1 Tax=Aspergillus kawachii TaxID=1069201 RepID=A0A146EXT3_ASPKA|nr:uncharacterized protein AKAW2_61300A [Aspergillus luchuensis]BCS03036.1 hypothetical protein AKAW2_61300A [Aspergillus luchuensis]BCS14685.1 hypothetical protein ALUC_61241A [Aspergillus luchuensis]GAA87812.1 similar to An12g09930 [Aspergillus luchuensis IFO 4308]GAT18602.1 similar to An12g09930 [Aspergillus luchuensis]